MNQHPKIKVTIITGFLGAGKTTFINKLLRDNQETQFALVENEFGDVAIDTKLIKGVDASQMFELKQGCICCTISDEYELVLQELAERFPNIEHLLIETTGVADPASVIRPFFIDENLKKIFHYNGAVCLVDAINFENSPEKEITLKQLVVADLTLVSKVENLQENKKKELVEKLQKINPFAKIEIFEIQTSSSGRLNSIIQKPRSEFDFVGTSVSHANLSTKTLSINQSIDKTNFLNWLEYTLDIHKNEIYRVKGILCFENEPYEYILQGVGGSFEITEGDLILNQVKSEVVFIGKLNSVDLKFESI